MYEDLQVINVSTSVQAKELGCLNEVVSGISKGRWKPRTYIARRCRIEQSKFWIGATHMQEVSIISA